MKSSAAMGDSCHIHSLSPLPALDQLQAMVYSESEVETDAAALQLETSMTTVELEMDTTALELETSMTALELETYIAALDLEMETDVPHELSKQERYSAD
jgi:hypothetical protein